jgi:hypothetical protein
MIDTRLWTYSNDKATEEKMIDTRLRTYSNDKATEEKMIDTRLRTYSDEQISELPSKSGNYGAEGSELLSKPSRFPEEIDGRPKIAAAELSSWGGG